MECGHSDDAGSDASSTAAASPAVNRRRVVRAPEHRQKEVTLDSAGASLCSDETYRSPPEGHPLVSLNTLGDRAPTKPVSNLALAKDL